MPARSTSSPPAWRYSARDGRILFHNAAFRTIWDLSPDWLASAPEESAILDQLRADRKLPEQVNYRDWRAKHLAAYRSAEPREELWHLPDGRTLRMVAMPNSEGGMTYIFENVTEQITLESRLEALLQLQGETLDHLTEAVAVFGTDGRLRLFNPVFANIWRLSPDAAPRGAAHRRDHRQLPGDLRRQARPGTKSAPPLPTSTTTTSPPGACSARTAASSTTPRVALPEGMTMLTFVDVTDSARIQRVLSERNEALEAADRLKSDFIQHVSYELRSPLQTIIGFSELLSDRSMGPLNAQQREYMDHIASSSNALLTLINDILDLATVDAGIMSLDIGEADIAEVAHSAVETLRDRLDEQKIALTIAIPRDIGTFHVDAQRVRQILFNLVSNAIRFSNAGGHIRLEAARRGELRRLHRHRRRGRHSRRRDADASSSRSRRMARRAAGAAPASACRSSRASSSCMAARCTSAPRRAGARRRSSACRSCRTRPLPPPNRKFGL